MEQPASANLCRGCLLSLSLTARGLPCCNRRACSWRGIAAAAAAAAAAAGV